MKKFKKTKKQTEATRLIGEKLYTMLVGGTSSGKTFINIYTILMRALARKSRHVAFRRTFNAIKRSIWYETLPDVLKICFPALEKDIDYRMNKGDWYFELSNKSMLWIAGLDEGKRLDKILGNRYSTILLNEASELNFNHVDTTKSRLTEKSGLPLKILGDCNPPSVKHWVHKQFIEGIHPSDNKKLSAEEFADYGYLYMNPRDNKANLAPETFKILNSMGAKKRARFRDGLFSSDTEGALWSNDLINRAYIAKKDYDPWMSDPPLTVVALDPNVAEDRKPGEEYNPDEAGIAVMSKNTPLRDSSGQAIITHDYSGKYSASEWAKKAVWAYQYHNANCVVAEKNQGGALVKMALRAEDNTVPVELVHASKGKHIRAEPIVTLYENGQIKHAEGLDELENEMLEFVPGISGDSPNRMDAAVWGSSYLFLSGQQRGKIPRIRIR